MSRKNVSIENSLFVTPPAKKLRFRGTGADHQNHVRGDSSNLFQQYDERIEDGLDGGDDMRRYTGNNINKELFTGDGIGGAKQKGDDKKPHQTTTRDEKPSLMDFFKLELTRGYLLEHDEERYTARREKMYTFMRIPREVEKFMFYGVLQCADSFLYIHTFLPIRYVLALWAIIYRPIAKLFGFSRRNRILTSAEICDLLKGTIWIICCIVMLYIDTNRIYHVIKSQSFIKLYIFYNMLEVGDRLLSSFGQDTIDALFWTATESKNSRKEHLGLVSHIIFALIYMGLHSTLIMFQSTTLNVAVNSSNKGLLMIMMSNNFVELKGSVFKKFDKNNLFQLSCSDVRERFHLAVLLFIVVIQTMKEFSWKREQFWVMFGPCMLVLVTEFFIDWIKHAFITRFNELPVDVYKEYTLSLAYDMTQTRQKHAFSDHSDLVARRMGFIAFPLAVVLFKALYHAITIDTLASLLLVLFAYLILVTTRICSTIYALGKACDLMEQHSNTTMNTISTSTPHKNQTAHSNSNNNNNNNRNTITIDSATSPFHSVNSKLPEIKIKSTLSTSTPTSSIDSCLNTTSSLNTKIIDDTATLGATALFSNSDVDLDDVCLNDNLIIKPQTTNLSNQIDQDITRSVPDLQHNKVNLIDSNDSYNTLNLASSNHSDSNDHHHHHHKDDSEANSNDNFDILLTRRTHKRSESEPFIQNIHSNDLIK